jgi:N-acetylmuramoyl-L-alanine amidase
MIRSIFIALLFTTVLLAQDTLHQALLPVSDSLFLKVQMPLQDTMQWPGPKLRFAACTRPDAKAFVNGKSVKVYASGAFAGLQTYSYGTNLLRLSVKSANGDSLWHEFIINRPEPMKDSPHDTLVIESALMQPSEDLWLMSGDMLEVRFKGSPGWEAWFEIPGVESGIPMHELPRKEADGFAGIYSGRYLITPQDEVHDAQIIFHLKKSFWHKEWAYSRGKISILPKELPRIAELIGKRPFLNASLGTDRLGGEKIGFLQPGVRLIITGKCGSQYRVQLTQTLQGWLPEEFARLLPPGTPRSRADAGAVAVSGHPEFDLVTLNLNEKLPYSSEQSTDPNVLSVDVYGAASNTNWIGKNLSAKGIENVTCRQIASDHYRLLITLTHPHWGYDIDYAGKTMRIKIKRPPVFASRDSVFAGLTIAVDAGHGGDSHGAIGAAGSLEKDVTIAIARRLEQLLRSKGAAVLMTRTETEGPAMEDRIEKIVSSGANLLIAVHCNSCGDASDPIAIRGTSAYYKSLGFKPLADAVYAKMLDLHLPQFGEVGNFNFMLNSLTQMPNVLIETAFLSNPEEEMLLLDDNFRGQIAEHIAAGVEEYLRNNAVMKEH